MIDTYYNNLIRNIKTISINGREISEFEHCMRNFFQIKHAILTSSGTASLNIALMAVKAKNMTVAIPSFSFISPALAALSSSANIRFVDVEKNSLCSSAKNFFNENEQYSDIIIPTHIGGLSCNMEELMVESKHRNTIVIEDAAQAFGCEFNGKKLGTFGDIGIFSFGKSKFPTCGEGGLIITNNDQLALKCRSLINYGRKSLMEPYIHIEPGLNGKISDIQAYLLLSQIKDLNKIIQIRDNNGRYLLNCLAKMPGFKAINTTWNNLSSYYMPAFIYSGGNREVMINSLTQAGFPVCKSNKFPFPLYSNPCFDNYPNVYIDSILNVEKIYSNLIVIGHHGQSNYLDLNEYDFKLAVTKQCNNIKFE